jgi:DNA-binding response OmpR family regulator
VSYAGSPFNSVINIVYDNTLRGAAALPIPTDTFPAFLYPKVEICFSRNPLSTEHIDLYVVPAVILPLHQKLQSPQPCGTVPVIAYGPEKLLALAFDCGCCDYLRSPWALNELKVRALRAFPPRQLEFEWGTITLEGEVLRLLEPAAVRPSELTLSAPETAILRRLILQSGSPVSRECLQAGLQRHSGKTTSPAGRSVDVHISTLRKKFNLLSGNALQPHPIRSIYGYGYVLIHKQSTPYSCRG